MNAKASDQSRLVSAHPAFSRRLDSVVAGRIAVVLAGLLAVLPAGGRSGGPVDEPGGALQRSFIWLAGAPTGRQVYAVFRSTFELTDLPQSASLHLFADSRYMLWINGKYVDRGPCRFDPIAPEYDTLDVRPYLQPGTNAMAVLVHHYHDGKSRTDWVSINGRIMRHAPGLTARLSFGHADGRTATLVTDASWRGTTTTRFLPSPTDRWENTWASIPDRIDARRESDDWTQPRYDAAAWEVPVPVEGSLWGALRPRSIPRLRESEVGPITLLEHTGPRAGPREDSPRPKLLASVLPLALEAGDQLILDAGAFAQAYSVLEFEADDGSELELEYAQRYFDTGKKPSESYGRMNQYVARAGRQTYMSGDTFGFKYVVVRLKSGRVTLLGLRLVNRLYPFDLAGGFRSSDPMLNQLWTNCVNTIRLCSEDAFVDCATRERTEWMADGYAVAYRTARVALAGPGEDGRPRYADPRLLRGLLRRIGLSLQPDGRLKAHHPSDRWDIHGYIEDYSCLWVQALREYHDHTGDPGLTRELWPALTAQLQWFLDRRSASGLVQAREFVYFGNPLAYQVCEGATLNAFLHGALRDAAFLAEQLGLTPQATLYRDAAEALRRALNDRLWDAASGTYFGSLAEGKPTRPTAHAAVCCLQFGIVPPEREPQTRRWLLEHHRQEGFSPYAHQYLLEQIYRIDTDAADREALDLIRTRWAAMARSETGTVWEGFGPGENCHEAGAVPAYFLSAAVLGVRLDGPVGARRLILQPRLGDLRAAEGIVVTELGPVPVRWERGGRNAALDFDFEVPPGVAATVALPLPGGEPEVELDGQTVSPPNLEIHGRAAVLAAGPGRHRGSIRVRPASGGWPLGPFIKHPQPVLSPRPEATFRCPVLGTEVRWEAQNVYNPAAVVRDGKVHLLYRADDRNPALPWGRTCRIGLASSEDGTNFTRHSTPVLYPDNDEWKPYEWEGGCEDLHVIEDDDGLYYLNYTTWNGHSDTVSVASSRDLVHWTKHGPAFRKAGRTGGRSGVVVSRLAGTRLVAARIDGKYWMYYTHPCAIAWSTNLIDWTPVDRAVWPGGGREAGAIALLRDEGILLMTQGAHPARGAWTLRQTLIDPTDLAAIRHDQAEPFLWPELEWERRGFAADTTVANALVPFRGQWLLYYGAADRCIGLATCRTAPRDEDVSGRPRRAR